MQRAELTTDRARRAPAHERHLANNSRIHSVAVRAGHAPLRHHGHADLIFVLFSPRVINFNDKPVARNPHPTEVVVTADAEGHLYLSGCGQRDFAGRRSIAVREQLLRIIEPISGAVSIVSYEAVSDGKGNVQSYKVLAKQRVVRAQLEN